jgi:hypothetical protein
VTKINPAGTAIIYSTYLGGGGIYGGDTGYGIAVDSAGSAYVTGITFSTTFPTKYPYQQGGYSGSYVHGGQDAFVTKLSPQGNSLVYSTYLGGSYNTTFSTASDGDTGYGIAVDSAGNAYVTGTTATTDFPMAGSGAAIRSYTSSDCISPGPTTDSHQACSDAFVVRLHANTGSSAVVLDYSTYLGGTGADWGSGIALDGSGNAYVTGRTWAPSTSFPIVNAWRSQLNGNDDPCGPSACPGVYAAYRHNDAYVYPLHNRWARAGWC